MAKMHFFFYHILWKTYISLLNKKHSAKHLIYYIDVLLQFSIVSIMVCNQGKVALHYFMVF